MYINLKVLPNLVEVKRVDLIDILEAFIDGVVALWPIYGFLLLIAGFRWLVTYLDKLREAGSGIFQLDKMNNQEMIGFMRGFFHDKGVDVSLIPEEIGYYGADLILNKDGIKVAVHVVASDRPVSAKAVQEAYGAKSHYHCHNAVVISNREFTPQAQAAAHGHGVILWGRNRLIRELLAEQKKNNQQAGIM